MIKNLFILLTLISLSPVAFADYPVSLTVQNNSDIDVVFIGRIGINSTHSYIRHNETYGPITINNIPGQGEQSYEDYVAIGTNMNDQCHVYRPGDADYIIHWKLKSVFVTIVSMGPRWSSFNYPCKITMKYR